MIVMTLRHFRIFQAVCKTGSITRGAEQLNIAQPAVSLAIKELEQFYQVQLFERMNRKIYLTEPGRKLLQYTDTVLSQVEESVQVIRDSKQGERYRFGINVTLAEACLPSLLQQIKKEIPQLELQVMVGNSSQLEESLCQNEIDFAVMDQIRTNTGMLTIPLAKEQMIAVCHPDYPVHDCISLEQLKQEKLLLREKTSGARKCVDNVFQEQGIEIVPVMESTSFQSLIACAESGLGIAILPEKLVDSKLQIHSLKKLYLAETQLERHYFMVYHPHKYRTPCLKSTMNVVQNYFSETLNR